MCFLRRDFFAFWILLHLAVFSKVKCIGDRNASEFDIDNKQDIPIVLSSEDKVLVRLVFSTGDVDLNLTAELDNGIHLNISKAVIDHETGNISYTIYASYMKEVEFGSYNLTFSLENSSTVVGTKIVPFIYEEPIAGLDVIIQRNVPVDEEQEFTIALLSGSNVMITWSLDNETQDLGYYKSPQNVSLSIQFTVPGQHNLTVVATNYVSWIETSVNVNAYDGQNVTENSTDITRFDTIPPGMNVVNMIPGENVLFHFEYNVGGPIVNFSAAISNGTLLYTSSSKLNISTKEVFFTLEHSSMISEGYGTYTLEFLLTPSEGNVMTKFITLHYEEPLAGLDIINEPYAPIDAEQQFNITFSRGSNVKIVCLVDNTTHDLGFHTSPRNHPLGVIFTTSGHHNVTVIAENTVSRAENSVHVTAYYRLNGFSVIVENTTVSTTDDAVFIICLSNVSQFPMGSISAKVVFGDGNLSTVDINENIAQMQTISCYRFSHQYSIIGNYTAIISIISKVDAITLGTFEMEIFEKGVTMFDTIPADMNVVYMLPGENVTFHFEYETGGDFINPVNFSAAISNGTLLDTSSSKLNTSTKEIFFMLEYTSMISEGYGMYTLEFLLTPSEGNARTNLIILHYEEPITGFYVYADFVLPVNEEVFFNASLTSGSNTKTEFLMHDTQKIVHFHNSGEPTYLRFNVIFTTTGEQNVTITISNAVSTTNVSLTVRTFHRINGFFVSSNVSSLTHLIGSRDTTRFSIGLNSNAMVPMGALDFKISFGDESAIKQLNFNETMSIMSGSDYVLYYQYRTQGNYTAEILISSEIDKKSYAFDIIVWDNLAVIIEAKLVGKVFESFNFTFSNPPPSGFAYNIDYGDGNSHSENESVWYYAYEDTPLIHSYNDDGVYHVSFYAWNQIYSSFSNFVITIQYPIPQENITLSPAFYVIPIPDGIMNFHMNLTEDNPQPSNVTCLFDFQDGDEIDRDVGLIFGSPVNKTFVYDFPGEKAVNFTCWNRVSSMTKMSNITVVNFTLDHFEIIYQSPVNMNTTLSNVVDLNYPRDTPVRKVQHSIVDVYFYVDLLRCHKLPPDIYFQWDFGDGSVETDLVQFKKIHTYTKRGHYEIKVTIFNNKTNEHLEIDPFIITMGIIQFSVEPADGIVSLTEFIFQFEGFEGNTSYIFVPQQVFSNTSFTLDDHIFQYIYPHWGQFQPFVFADNGTVNEIVYMETPVEVDFNLTALDISVNNGSVDTYIIHLPPGYLKVTISVSKYTRMPYTTCDINIGDIINDGNFSLFGNITYQEPLILEEYYYTLGNHTLIVNCTNYASSLYFEQTIYVYNECFTVDGIFDRQYSHSSTPMKTFSFMNTDLSTRMGVICTDMHSEFTWSVEQVIVNNSKEQRIPLDYKPAKNRGIARFGRGDFSQVTLRVILNVSLDGTWIHEFTYLEFIKTPPFAYIVGGNRRTVKYLEKLITIDALTESFATEKGRGGNEELEFIWECMTFNNTMDLHQKYSVLHNLSEECTLDDEERGKKLLNLSIGSYTQTYVIRVMVIDSELNSTFTQLIQVQLDDPPSITVRCKINCKEKVALGSPIVMIADCNDCLMDEKIYYQWSLWKHNGDVSTQVSDFEINTRGTMNQSIYIYENYIQAGETYVLKVEVSSSLAARNGSTVIAIELIANYPPYGGTCKINKLVYYVPTDTVNIECKGFADEGLRAYPNYTLDIGEKEPLTYLYETKTRKIDFITKMEEDIITESYKGGESSVINLPLQIGDEAFNYSVDMRVVVSDRFGDIDVFTFNITVMPDQRMLPKLEEDVNNAEYWFRKYKNLLDIINAGGNDLAVVRRSGSLASIIASVTDNGTDTEEENKIKTMLKNNMGQIMETMATAVLTENDEAKQISVSDTQQVSKNLEEVFRNPSHVSGKSTTQGSKVCAAIASKLYQSIYNVLPFPVEDYRSIEGSIHGAITTADKILSCLMPTEIVDVTKEISEQEIYKNLKEEQQNRLSLQTNESDYEKQTDEELRQEATRLYSIEQAKREEMIEKASQAENSVFKLLDTITSAYDVKLLLTEVGAGPSKITRENIELSVEKVTADILKNRTETAIRGILIGFEQNDTDSINGTLEIKQTVFNKPPTIYGEDAASITSRVIQLDLGNNSLAPRVSFTNPHYASARRVVPIFSPQDPEQMFYLSFEVVNDGDVSLIYIQPENFDIFHKDNLTLYDLYLGEGDLPKSTSNSFKHTFKVRDWDSDNGFKVMLPQMDKGKKYIGIKPYEVPKFLPPKKRRKERSLFDDDVVGRNSSLIMSNIMCPLDNSSHQNNTECIDPVVSITDTSVNISFEPMKANFSVIIVTTGCRSWNEAEKKWTTEGCMVLPMSTMNETVCRCPRSSGNIFATTFYVPPNQIDFRTVFSKFDAMNAAIYGTCIGILVVWVVAGIFLRRQDKNDQDKWRTRFLCDTDSSDDYFYMITVFTCIWRKSGTKSQVYFVLSGDKDDSGVRILSDGQEMGFPSGSVRSFFMGTKFDLGDLMMIRIWHDNSGTGNEQSWYLNKIIVDDLQKHKRFRFICTQWLALNEGDGEVERILPVYNEDENQKFNTLFFQQAEVNITENHLWLSTVFRPQKSNFTRVQRLSCIIALLFLTMISNAMFFRSPDAKVVPDQVRIGMLRFSTSTVFVSVIGILISTFPVLLVTLIFRNTRTKHVDKRIHDKENVCKILSNNVTVLGNIEDVNTFKYLPLPYVMKYVSWSIIFCSVVASTFFLILYSMQWGKAKSEEWVVSVFFSFTESIIIMDPLKVVIIAFVFAIICKSQSEDRCPDVNVNWLKTLAQGFESQSKRAFITLWDNVNQDNEIAKKEKVEILRKIRKEEVKAKKAMARLFIYLGYMLVLYSISYVNRDQRAFLLKNHVDKQLNTNSKSQTGFSSVSGKKMWIKWLNETVIPTFYPLTQYNGQNLKVTDQKLFGDLDSVRVGPARLRQVRMSEEKCMTSTLTGSYICFDPYDQYKEERNDHCLAWSTYNASVCDTPLFRNSFFTGNAWKYTHAEDIWGIPVSGQYAVYSGGGYLLPFDKDRQRAYALLNELIQYNWIDRGTRAIFVEFTLYNGNVDLFLYVQYLAEFTELGGSMIWIDSQSFRPVPTLSQVGAYSLVCYFLFCVFLLYRTVKLVIRIKNLPCRKFCSIVWNLVDLLCILLSYSLIVAFGFRISYADKAMGMFYDMIGTGDTRFINFQHIVIWDNVFNILLAVLIFVDTIRILRILGYNKRFSDVANVVSHASSELLGFGFLVGIVYTDYACLGNLLFGKTLKEYRSFFTAWASLTNALIGKNKVDELLAVAPTIAQVYYFTYVFCVIMILGTMFAAILNSSISTVRDESLKESETFGISDLITQAFRNVFGMFFNHRKKDARKRYMISPNSSRFDTFNILQLVRGTFKEYDTDSKENKAGEDASQSEVGDSDMYIDNQTKPSLEQPEEPVSIKDDDIQFCVKDNEYKKKQRQVLFF